MPIKLKNILFILILLAAITLAFIVILSFKKYNVLGKLDSENVTLEIKEGESIKSDKNIITLNTNTNKNHKNSKNARIHIEETTGICRVITRGRPVRTHHFGHKLRYKYYELKKQFVKKYGHETDEDNLLFPDSALGSERYWMKSLMKEERILASYFDNLKSKSENGIISIKIEAKATTINSGYIETVYTFSHVADCKKYMAKKAGKKP